MTEPQIASPDGYRLLCQTLAHLRDRWPQDWPGLPVVLDACHAQLWPNQPPHSPDAIAMRHAALAMARHMEDLARHIDHEPDYHNRLHTADALVSLCWLLLVLKAQGHAVSDEWTACLLLAVTSHDVLHPGGANSHLQEFEQQSVNLLQRLANEHQVSAHWLAIASHLILHTDPALVAANHDKVQHTPFAMNRDWATVLMNEADILASATHRFGPSLGRALADEWQWRQHPLHAVVGTDAGRLNFLSTLRFSTPASLAMHLPEQVAAQRSTLQAP